MSNVKLKSYLDIYTSSLYEKVVPFWENHSIDATYGGFFTCLGRTGTVYDTDKFAWLQFRQVWTFAKLYDSSAEPKSSWLTIAEQGAAFMLKNGLAEDKTWYFSLTQSGEPLIQPYNIFSDCFAAQAFGQLYQVTQKEAYKKLALDTFNSILERKDNPKRHWSKAVEGTRPLKNFALPMILCNLALELEPILDASLVKNLIDDCVHEVMEVFPDKETGLILENVTSEGGFSDSFEGRLLNPGHAIEAMWFIMDIGVRLDDKELIQKAVDITLQTLEYAWDEAYGGIFYFMDIKNRPPQQLEWDQKLWWVHLETLVALLKGYQLTGNQQCWEWFEKVHVYAFKHFADPEHGEWFGYLNRRGEVLLDLKGGKWKGCYHVPRGLFQCMKTLEAIIEKIEK